MSSKAPKFPIAHNIAVHGKAAFDVQEIFVAFSKQDLNWAEQLFIAALRPTLNKTKGGAGSPRKLSAKECLARSEVSKRKWADPEWRAQMVEKLKRAVRPVVPYEVLRARGKAVCEKRWLGHIKKVKPFVGIGALTAQTWKNPEVRAKRIAGIREANARPEVQAKKVLAGKGRVMPRESVEKTARAKWKPVYCPELQTSFLSQKHAAEFLGVLKTSVCNAIKTKGRVNKQFTLVMVA